MTEHTEVVELQVQADGSLVAVGTENWQEILQDTASIESVYAVTEDDMTWDVYTIVHSDGIERVYALVV